MNPELNVTPSTVEAAWMRDLPGKLIGGVCSALAAKFGWSAVVVRMVFVISLAFSGGLALWVYLSMWALTPFNARTKAPAARLLGSMSKFFTSSVIEAPSNVNRVE